MPRMNPFKFHIIPNPRGGFTARPVLGTPVDEAALTAAIAAQAGVTPQQADAVVRALADQLLAQAAAGHWSLSLYDSFGIRPKAGGSQPLPDDFQTVDQLQLGTAIHFTAARIAKWRRTLRMESQGSKGRLSPIIATTLSEPEGLQDRYNPGTLIRLVGHRLRFNPQDPEQGVTFIRSDETEVRATVYGGIRPKAVNVLVPADLSGPLRIRIAAHINGSVRSYTYTTPIT